MVSMVSWYHYQIYIYIQYTIILQVFINQRLLGFWRLWSTILGNLYETKVMEAKIHRKSVLNHPAWLAIEHKHNKTVWWAIFFRGVPGTPGCSLDPLKKKTAGNSHASFYFQLTEFSSPKTGREFFGVFGPFIWRRNFFEVGITRHGQKPSNLFRFEKDSLGGGPVGGNGFTFHSILRS